MEYNFRNVVICWQISKSFKVVLRMFALASSHRYRDINISNILTFKKYVKVVKYNFRNEAMRW